MKKKIFLQQTIFESFFDFWKFEKLTFSHSQFFKFLNNYLFLFQFQIHNEFLFLPWVSFAVLLATSNRHTNALHHRTT